MMVDVFKNSSVKSIYSSSYAKNYSKLYTQPWPGKHKTNIRNIAQIINQLPQSIRWLDIACGQGWHFSQFAGAFYKIGLDISHEQLAIARNKNSDAFFICADMSKMNFESENFNLVTSFWAAYAYLNNLEKIKSFINQTIDVIEPGGTMYLETLLPDDLKSFNLSNFAKQNGFLVEARMPDFTEWSYIDSGGHHQMMSPPLDFFLNLISRYFNQITVKHDGGFMVHLVASKKRLI